ncbi:MAG TPA: hypothetical protein VHK91_00680 [Flavisolibacter sp.]|jgi:hypothetical protein|nr:hypothetical protein [Flavisolibacter sp.]
MKENKGGFLSNDQVEADNKIKGKQEPVGGYSGSQDTGEQKPRDTKDQDPQNQNPGGEGPQPVSNLEQ